MTQLNTIRPTITFRHGDGSIAEASARAVRLFTPKGSKTPVLCVERRNRLLPITVTGANNAEVNLGVTPLAQGYENAQAIAPVATLAQLGVKRAPKEPKAAVPAYARASTKKGGKAAAPDKVQIAVDDALARIRETLVGASQDEITSVFASLLTAPTEPKAARRGRRSKR